MHPMVISLLNHWVIKNSPHVRESFCLLNPESGNILLVEFGILGLRIPKIQLNESGIPLTIGIQNPESKFPLTKAGIQNPRPPGGYSIYPWVGRCGPAPHTLTLFKAKIADFPTLFKTEKFCCSLVCGTYAPAVYRPRKDTLFKTNIDKIDSLIKTKMIKSIPCLRQKSRKTYPGWPYVPIEPL